MNDEWPDILATLGKGSRKETAPSRDTAGISWQLYRDLARDCVERPIVIAQIGQSLDGRIATASGHSHYINGAESLDHLHRLRAIADAVIVGANTAVLDNPRLTTRRVSGPNPVRVVIDPKRRVPAEHALLAEPDAETFLVTSRDISGLPPHCFAIAPADDAEQVSPGRLLEQLRNRDLRTILIEGGGNTISRFLSAGLIDRLHIAVAPMLIGSGRPGLELPEIETLADARRFKARTYKLGQDTLFDCRLN